MKPIQLLLAASLFTATTTQAAPLLTQPVLPLAIDQVLNGQ